jgi:hypothetical protein
VTKRPTRTERDRQDVEIARRDGTKYARSARECEWHARCHALAA